jgi:hypothetical protein
MTDPTKNVFDTQDIWPYFNRKSKSKKMDFLTNQGNTDTGIRLKIKTMQINVFYLLHCWPTTMINKHSWSHSMHCFCLRALGRHRSGPHTDGQGRCHNRRVDQIDQSKILPVKPFRKGPTNGPSYNQLLLKLASPLASPFSYTGFLSNCLLS